MAVIAMNHSYIVAVLLALLMVSSHSQVFTIYGFNSYANNISHQFVALITCNRSVNLQYLV